MKALTALLLSATVFTAAPAFAADETAGWQDNKPQSLESLKAPVRVVNLWATWCGPCRKEMPAMSAWYKAQKKRQRRYGRHRAGYDRQHRQIPETNAGQLPDLALYRCQQPQLHESPRQQCRRIALHSREAPKCGYKQTITGEVNEKSLTAAVNLAKPNVNKTADRVLNLR